MMDNVKLENMVVTLSGSNGILFEILRIFAEQKFNADAVLSPIGKREKQIGIFGPDEQALYTAGRALITDKPLNADEKLDTKLGYALIEAAFASFERRNKPVYRRSQYYLELRQGFRVVKKRKRQ